MKIRILEKLFLVTINFFCIFVTNIRPNKTSEYIQQLHTKISNDLLSIRKTFPKSQPKIYALLDEVCKIYKISKTSLEQIDKAKKIMGKQSTKYKTMLLENNSLKIEIEKVKKELNSTHKSLKITTKNMQEKEKLLSNAFQEKQKLTTERNKLAEEKKQLMLNVTKTENLAKKNKNNLPQENKNFYTSNKLNKTETKTLNPYNLNLTSTSDPTSPA